MTIFATQGVSINGVSLQSNSGSQEIGYGASGTNATSRNVYQKLSELVTVTDYTNMQSAYNSLPSNGGIVLVPPGYSETWASNLVMNKPFSGFIFMGDASIQMGNYQLIMNDSCPGQFIDTWSAVSGGDYFAQTNQGVFFKYANSATNTAAMQIGQGTLVTGSTQDCFRRLRGFALNTEYAGNGTIGIQCNNQLRMNIEGVNIKNSGGGNGGMLGIQLNAVSTGYVGWVNIRDSFCQGGQIGVQTVGQVNLCTWNGGGCSTTTTAGTSWGIKRGTNGGSGFFASNIEIAGATRAVELMSGVSLDNYQIYGESNTYDVYFDTGATNNFYQNTAANIAPVVSDGNGATSTNVAVPAGSIGGTNVYIGGNGNALYGTTSSGNIRKLLSFSGSNTTYYGDSVGDILNHQFLASSGSLAILNVSGLSITGGLGVNGASPQAKVTGWGAPTNAAIVNNFNGSTATTAQCASVIAELITVLKSNGILGA